MNKYLKCGDCAKYKTDACEYTNYAEETDNLCPCYVVDVDEVYEKGRADAIEIVHRFFMDEMHTLETYIDEDDGISEIYKDTKQANYLLNMNKMICERIKEQKNEE